MKIAILTFYSGHFERGVENWTYELATRVNKKHDVTVFQNSPPKKQTEYKIIANNVPIDWNKKSSDGSFLRRIFWDYWSKKIASWTIKNLPNIWKEKYDIIIPTDGGWQVALIRIITWLSGVKMVVVGHSGRGWDDRNNLWSFPDVFISLTETNFKWAKNVNPFVKILKIENGVDLNIFKKEGTVAKINLKKPVVIAAGALQKGKRLDLTIKAVAKLNNVSLLILGKGDDEANIKKIGNELLGTRFLLLNVNYKDIVSFYRSGDIFTLPSWGSEAFGMVYLEAMASGLPVVATNDEIRKEIIGDAGILVDPENIAEYAKALQKALDTDWNNIPRRQAEKFSWKVVSKKYIDLFEDLTIK